MAGSRDAAAGLRRGVLLLIDYGYPAAELYDPVRRRDGTLRAYLRHRVHDDPYVHVGRQDLTAHVDVTAVERAARAAGLTTSGPTTQAEFLVGLGTKQLLQAIQADPATTMEGYLAVRSALVRLLDPPRWAGSGSWPSGAAGRTDRRRLASTTASAGRPAPSDSRGRRADAPHRHPDRTKPHRNRAMYLLLRGRRRAHDLRWSGTT